jgi:hypothetical protein
VRLTGALAAILGGELSEDEPLKSLRLAGLTTYPSPLLGRLLKGLPEVFAAEVLTRVDPADRAYSRRWGRCRWQRWWYPACRVRE